MRRATFLVERPTYSALRAINYSRSAERFRNAKGGDAPPLKHLIREIGAAYGAVFTRHDCDPNVGVDLLSQVDMFASEPACRVIRRDSMPKPERHLVTPGQILIAGAGQMGESALFGRATIADRRLVGRYVGPHIVALTIADVEDDASYYLYAFLASAAGLDLIRSTAYGTSVPSIRLDLLANLPIPQPPTETQARVGRLVRLAMKERERFAEELQKARAPIEELPAMREAHAACAARRSRVGLHSPPFATLSAWNHVSSGAALPDLRRVWKARLGDVVPPDGIFNGLRFARVPCESPYGVELLSQRDVFMLKPVPQRVLHPGFADKWLFAPEGSLLVGGAGTLGEGEIFGRAVYVSPEMSRYAVSEHMLRVQPRRGEAAVAYAYLSTLVGRRLLRSTAVGTKILSMRPDLLRALPFPEVDSATAERVTARLREAMRARDGADRAEAEAIRLVETEVIPAWLN